MSIPTPQKKPHMGADLPTYEPAFSEAMKELLNYNPPNLSSPASMHQFIAQENLPPFYKIKAHILLESVDESDDPRRNLEVNEYHLRAAAAALKGARDTYVHDQFHAKVFGGIEEVIEEKWTELRRREKKAQCRGNGIRQGDAMVEAVQQVDRDVSMDTDQSVQKSS